MPADLEERKRRRRQAARTLLADAKPVDSRSDRETALGETGVVLASPAPTEPEPEGCCARLLRLFPRAVRVRFDAVISLE